MAKDNNLDELEVQREEVLTTRRDALLAVGRWSKIVIGAAVFGGLFNQAQEAEAGAWVNSRGAWGNGGNWHNHGGGGAWGNGIVGGGAWANGGHAWANVIGGGGAWSNHGKNWVNRRGGGGWINHR